MFWILQPATHNDYDGYSIYTDPSRYPHDPKPIQPIPSPTTCDGGNSTEVGGNGNLYAWNTACSQELRLAGPTQVANIKERCMSAQGAIVGASVSLTLPTDALNQTPAQPQSFCCLNSHTFLVIPRPASRQADAEFQT